MSDNSVRPRLNDILEAIDGISRSIAGVSYESYLDSWLLRSAVERGIEIISEATRHIPPTMTARFPEIPWSRVAGIGNILRHGYAGIEHSIIWNVAMEHLAPLEKVVRAMLAELEKAND